MKSQKTTHSEIQIPHDLFTYRLERGLPWPCSSSLRSEANPKRVGGRVGLGRRFIFSSLLLGSATSCEPKLLGRLLDIKATIGVLKGVSGIL